MAVGGRKPKPRAIRETMGNPGRRPLPDAVPPFPVEGLEPAPEWFGAWEREEWDRLVPALVTLGIGRGVHRGAIEGVCALYGSWRAHQESGDSTKMRLEYDAYRKALNEFGLTPASATRVPWLAPHDESDEDDYFGSPRVVS